MPKRFTIFHILGIDGYTRHRADLHTLGFVEVTHAFCAFGRINFVDLLAKVDRFVGALRLAHIAVDAFIGDDQSHGLTSPHCSKKFDRGSICELSTVSHPDAATPY